MIYIPKGMDKDIFIDCVAILLTGDTEADWTAASLSWTTGDYVIAPCYDVKTFAEDCADAKATGTPGNFIAIQFRSSPHNKEDEKELYGRITKSIPYLFSDEEEGDYDSAATVDIRH